MTIVTSVPPAGWGPGNKTNLNSLMYVIVGISKEIYMPAFLAHLEHVLMWLGIEYTTYTRSLYSEYR